MTTRKGHIEIRLHPNLGWQYRFLWDDAVPWLSVPKPAAATMTEIMAGRQFKELDQDDKFRIEHQLYAGPEVLEGK